MKAEQLVYNLDQVCQGHYGNDTLAKVSALNRAIDYFFNAVAPRVDKDGTFTRWLMPLKCLDEGLTKKKRGRDFVLYNLPLKWGHTIRVEIEAEKEGCKDKFFQVRPKRSKSVGASRSTRYGKPNFFFEYTFYEYEKGGLRIFTDNDFKIKKAYISYLSCIPYVHYVVGGEVGYIYPDGTKIESNVDLVLGKGASVPLLEIASLMKMNLSTADLQKEVYRILNIKNILR
jgi:hypothetical protein